MSIFRTYVQPIVLCMTKSVMDWTYCPTHCPSHDGGVRQGPSPMPLPDCVHRRGSMGFEFRTMEFGYRTTGSECPTIDFGCLTMELECRTMEFECRPSPMITIWQRHWTRPLPHASVVTWTMSWTICPIHDTFCHARRP